LERGLPRDQERNKARTRDFEKVRKYRNNITMKNIKQRDKDKKSKDIKKLVIARLEALPSDKMISIGDLGEFTRDDLIERVDKGDEVGDKITEIQLEYLRLLKEGIFYDKETVNHQTKA